MALDAPHLVIPILATALVSPAEGAAFYAAWTMLAFVYVLPVHLGTTLFAIGAADRAGALRNARFTLRLALLGGAIGVPMLVLLGPSVLRLFGPAYAAWATAPLRLLSLGYFPMVFLAHFVAIRRIEGKVGRTALVVSIAGLVEISAGAVGAIAGGMTGLAVGVLAGKLLQGAATAPFVLRALAAPKVSTDHESPAMPGGPDED
jgi:hypothetical protein